MFLSSGQLFITIDEAHCSFKSMHNANIGYPQIRKHQLTPYVAISNRMRKHDCYKKSKHEVCVSIVYDKLCSGTRVTFLHSTTCTEKHSEMLQRSTSWTTGAKLSTVLHIQLKESVNFWTKNNLTFEFSGSLSEPLKSLSLRTVSLSSEIFYSLTKRAANSKPLFYL